MRHPGDESFRAGWASRVASAPGVLYSTAGPPAAEATRPARCGPRPVGLRWLFLEGFPRRNIGVGRRPKPMPIVFSCPCGQAFRARETAAGKRVKCSKCGGIVVVPQPEPPAPEGDAEPSSPEPAPPAAYSFEKT